MHIAFMAKKSYAYTNTVAHTHTNTNTHKHIDISYLYQYLNRAHTAHTQVLNTSSLFSILSFFYSSILLFYYPFILLLSYTFIILMSLGSITAVCVVLTFIQNKNQENDEVSSYFKVVTGGTLGHIKGK